MKLITALLLVLLPFTPFLSNGSDKGHDIHIKVKGIPKDSTARIGYYYGANRFVAQDTAKADNKGGFLFKSKKDLPEGVYICLLPKGYFEFLVKGEQSFSMETDTSDLDIHMKIKGSKENTIFYEFRKYTTIKGRKADSLSKILAKRKNADSVKMLRQKLRTIDREVDSFRRGYMAQYPFSFEVQLLKSVREPEVPDAPILSNGRKDSIFPYRYFKGHYFDNLNFANEWISRTPFYESKLEYYFKDLVQPFADSIINDADALIEKSKAGEENFKYTLSWILNHYEMSEYMGMDAVTSHIIEKYYLSGQAKWVSEKDIAYMRHQDSIASHLLIGKQAPDLYMTDSTGKMITLYSVKKKYTIVYIWDATCGHCQIATPKLHDFYEKNKSKLDLEVYAATIERKTPDWKKYIREKKIGDWINVWDSLYVTDFGKRYGETSTPLLYVLDANKKIIAKKLDPGQLQDFFDNLEKRNKAKL